MTLREGWPVEDQTGIQNNRFRWIVKDFPGACEITAGKGQQGNQPDQFYHTCKFTDYPVHQY
jgi:hypothetical protein